MCVFSNNVLAYMLMCRRDFDEFGHMCFLASTNLAFISDVFPFFNKKFYHEYSRGDEKECATCVLCILSKEMKVVFKLKRKYIGSIANL